MNALPLYRTFRFRIIVSITLIHVVLMSLFAALVIQREEHTVDQVLNHNAHRIARMVAVAVRNAVLTENLGTLDEIATDAAARAGVRRLQIRNASGILLARVGPPQPRRRWRTVTEAVRVGRYRVGLVVLSLSRAAITREILRARMLGALFTVAALVIGGAAGWAISRTLTRDLYRLVEDVAQIGGDAQTPRIPVASGSEVGLLAQAFNAMLDRIGRANAEVAIERSKQAESERLACVGEMAAAFVHEIRNPLASIVHGVELVIDDQEASAGERRELAQIIRGETRRVNRILQEFLKWGRPAETHLEWGSLNHAVSEVVEIYDQTLNRDRQHEISFSGHVAGNRALFDPDQIRQVVWNLLLNGSEASGARGQLSLRTDVEGEWLVIVVSDSGPGIGAADQEQVFRPFYTTREGGTGLGLALVRGIASGHGGWVQIRNGLARGAEVWFAIKRGSVDDGENTVAG
ncbi:MAG TPA: ATP-binding protein [Acidiferrobacteraceae bacterium]|nr:ATP-binding protein [Acidiferrobacteraceae bacterium]